MIESNHIKLYRSLFRGRDDAFAIRWEKGNKAVICRPTGSIRTNIEFIKRKAVHLVANLLSSYQDKTFQPLTDEQLKRHLLGEQLIGIYPLLFNNTSHFIAADFDGENWLEEA